MVEEAEGVVFIGGVIEDVCSYFIHGCVYGMDHILVLRSGNLVEVLS